MKNLIELTQSQIETVRNNSAAAGMSMSAMVGRLLDDEFGGMRIGASTGATFQSIQHHLKMLETILRSR